MINYIEKGIGLHEAIRLAGHWLRDENGVWVSSNDLAVQNIINGFDNLPDIKASKVASIKLDGLARINTLFPAIASLDEIAFYAEFWTSITPATRAPTVSFKKIIDIYSAAKTAIVAVNAASTKVQVDAVIVNWPV